MRTSAGGPWRAMMMLVPLVVVGVLASMGGYHYRSVVASQFPKVQEGELSEDAVIRDASVGESARCSTDELFADFLDEPSSEDRETLQREETTDFQVGDVVLQDITHHRERVRPQAESDRRFPATALAGWKVTNSPTDQSEAEVDDGDIVEAAVTEATYLDTEVSLADENRIPLTETETTLEPDTRAEKGSVESFDLDSLFEDSARSEVSERRVKNQPPKTAAPTKPVSGNRRRSRVPRTLKEAAQQLAELGIRKYRLETHPKNGNYRFRCAVTEVHNPSVRRQFEAIDDEPLLAVRRVLRQVEAWRAEK